MDSGASDLIARVTCSARDGLLLDVNCEVYLNIDASIRVLLPRIPPLTLITSSHAIRSGSIIPMNAAGGSQSRYQGIHS